ncbi:Uncharacterised protein [uncultured archaeon]|nr:Uncharacterised protein [uncultured archaeon]
MTGFRALLRTSETADIPPRSAFPESASMSSMKMSFRAPESEAEDAAEPMIRFTPSLFLCSDELTSTVSQPISLASARTIAPFPVPGGP